MAKQRATAAFGWTDPLCTLLPSLMAGDLPQVVLARPPHRFSFPQGSSADVILLPAILFSRITKGSA